MPHSGTHVIHSTWWYTCHTQQYRGTMHMLFMAHGSFMWYSCGTQHTVVHMQLWCRLFFSSFTTISDAVQREMYHEFYMWWSVDPKTIDCRSVICFIVSFHITCLVRVLIFYVFCSPKGPSEKRLIRHSVCGSTERLGRKKRDRSRHVPYTESDWPSWVQTTPRPARIIPLSTWSSVKVRETLTWKSVFLSRSC